MNDALTVYENENEVVCITGYIYPVNKQLPNNFFLKGTDCWGWATWKRGWGIFENDGNKLLTELETENLTFDFDFYNSYPFVVRRTPITIRAYPLRRVFSEVSQA